MIQRQSCIQKQMSMQEKKAVKGDAGAAADPVSAMITEGLGGKSNISDVDCCATRLRITVKDAGKVKDEILKQTGSRGIVKKAREYR